MKLARNQEDMTQKTILWAIHEVVITDNLGIKTDRSTTIDFWVPASSIGRIYNSWNALDIFSRSISVTEIICENYDMTRSKSDKYRVI